LAEGAAVIVTIWKTIEVQAEAEVSIDDMIREFGARKDEASADYYRRLIPAIDAMTRILSGIPDEVIHEIPERARRVISERLRRDAERFWKMESSSETQ
jgi:molecular chaperone GrpE (heat shock protein)